MRAVTFLATAIAAVWLAFGYAERPAVAFSFGSATQMGSWTKGHHHRIRLLDGGPIGSVPNGRWVGVHIELDPKWKTYWANPGDSGGVPPLFTVSGSTNVRGIDVKLPAPRRIIDKYGLAIGYKDRVVFPIQITAEDASRPVDLKLKAQYGVCLEICIPAETVLTARIDMNRSAMPEGVMLVQTAVSQVPLSAGAVSETSDVPTIVAVTATVDGAKPKLEVTADFESKDDRNDLFTQVDGDSYLAMAQEISAKPVETGERKTFEIDLTKGDDLKYLRGQTVRFTVTGADRARTFRWRFPK